MLPRKAPDPLPFRARAEEDEEEEEEVLRCLIQDQDHKQQHREFVCLLQAAAGADEASE